MAAHTIEPDLAVLSDLASKKIDADLFTVMREAAIGMALYKADQAQINPLLERAFADKSVTAWVMANDGMAFRALRFLERAGIRVPQDISILGFDNVPESFEMKLTTYDFSLSSIVHRMLWFILHPDLRRGKCSKNLEEVEGVIVERGTAGPAGKSKAIANHHK
jgi:DNA-binding LacI/PurR family transcriptional regulator